MEIFSGSDKKLLLELARSAVARRLDIPVPDVPKSSQAGSLLDKNFGLFVTLKMDGKLRGCIGYLHGDYPIKESVKKAAFKDLPYPGTVLVADEAHLVKSYKSARTRAFRLMSRRISKTDGLVWMMTGTPVLASPKELWALLQAQELGSKKKSKQ